DPAAAAAIALAEAGVLYDAFGSAQGPADNDVPDTLAHAERAVELARRTGDPLAETAALDAVTGAQSWGGDAFGVAATLERRVDLVSPLPESPQRTLELTDALVQAIEAAIGIGDLAGARRWERRLAEHPLLAEVGYRASAWLLVTTALGDGIADAPAIGDRFIEAWHRAGSPAGTYLGPAVAGAAMMSQLRGDAEGRWDEVAARIGALPGHEFSYRAIFDGIRLLHTGHPDEAWRRLAPEPRAVWKWVTWIWLHWYVALRAEAAVLAEAPEAERLVAEAREFVAGNPTAEALVERADALRYNDRDRVLSTAPAFGAAGNGYQAARTLVLAGGDAAAHGQAALADLGLTPMAPIA
ncbi:MAG TPA: ATPase, partial [Stackebrandtia sp.]|nr:ATPase [Stackebrandtia sp.]